jgi:hypothetical protein
MTERKTARGISAAKTAALAMAAVLTIALAVAPRLGAQAAASRILGTVTAINGTTITVKPAQGDAQQVAVPSGAAIKRIEPGQTNLSAAVDMQFSDLTVGDHVLVNLDPNSTSTPQAVRVVAIKAADVAKKQQQESDAWSHGVGGLVKTVDAASGTITLTTGAGPTAKSVTVHVTAATELKRYAPGSVRFDDSTTAPISAIQPGDQLRARGTRNDDGSEMTADAVVSGGFRNISGTIVSIDPAGSALVVKDLATKKPVTVHITASAQMKQLPDRTAQMIAARLKGAGAAQGAGQGTAQGAAAGAGAAGGTGNGGAARGGAIDAQQMLSRAPTIQLTDLQKNEAVMLVSTQGTSDVTAITLLAGVEALLEAPASQDLLSNWSMGTGEAEAGAQ